VGTIAPGGTGVTVAVIVTGSPNVDGSGEVATSVFVADWATICVALLLDGPNVESPL
jgi:hypothetical protein